MNFQVLKEEARRRGLRISDIEETISLHSAIADSIINNEDNSLININDNNHNDDKDDDKDNANITTNNDINDISNYDNNDNDNNDNNDNDNNVNDNNDSDNNDNDNMSFQLKASLRKAYAICPNACTNSNLADGLIKYFNYNAQQLGTSQFDVNNASDWSKIIKMHVRIKPAINRSGGMKNKALNPLHALILDVSPDGFNLFDNKIENCSDFINSHVYGTELYMNSVEETEAAHWFCNKYDDEATMDASVIASRGYERLMVILIYLVIYLGIDKDGKVIHSVAYQICQNEELVSDHFLKNFRGISLIPYINFTLTNITR